MSNKEGEIRKLIEALMSLNQIRSLEDLGERLGTDPSRGRGAKYKKAKRITEDLSTENLLMLSGLFGVPYEKLKNADSSLLNSSTNISGTGNIIGENNVSNIGNNSEISAAEFMKMSEKEREDYLKFLELTKK